MKNNLELLVGTELRVDGMHDDGEGGGCYKRVRGHRVVDGVHVGMEFVVDGMHVVITSWEWNSSWTGCTRNGTRRGRDARRRGFSTPNSGEMGITSIRRVCEDVVLSLRQSART